MPTMAGTNGGKVRPPVCLLINDQQAEANGVYYATPDDRLALLRGSLAALPISCVLWAGIITAVLAWLG